MMTPEEKEIAELHAFDEEWKHGSRARAKSLAKEYVNRERERLTPILAPLTLENLVKLIDLHRTTCRHCSHVEVGHGYFENGSGICHDCTAAFEGALPDALTHHNFESREEDRIIADMWLLSEYEPQRIAGVFDIKPQDIWRALGKGLTKGGS